MEKTENMYSLRLQHIEDITNRAREYFMSKKVSKKEALVVTLTIEEALLKFRDKMPEETEVTYREAMVLGQPRIALYIPGSSLNPFQIVENPGDVIMGSLMSNAEGTPTWKFKNFINELIFPAKREKRATLLLKLLCGILVGLVCGLLCRLLPSETASFLADQLVQPLASAYTNIICVMGVLMTFLAMVLGIIHAGDLTTISTIGKRLMGRLFLMANVLVLIFTACLLPFVPFGQTETGSFDFMSIYEILLEFIPSNPVEPFIDYNVAQITVIGIMFGITMLILGRKSETMTDFFTECNTVAAVCNSFLNSSLIHIYVGLNFFMIAATEDLTSILSYAKIFLVVLLGFLFLMIVYTLYVCRKLKCTPAYYLREMSPTFMINLASANYGASFQTSYETMMNRGMHDDYLMLGHSVAGLLFKPAYAVLFIGTTLFAAMACGQEFSAGWIVMLFLLSMILSCTLPTIPGAAVSGFALIFAQFELPSEALAIAATMNVILDFFTVAVNGFCLQSELFIGAAKQKKLDRDKFFGR